ncbi:MAG: rod shape-determining protein MreD [Gemmatimonadetes bacterium]|nr:rod shape-determining protein MreD [Gemmatimonadota bacterium]
MRGPWRVWATVGVLAVLHFLLHLGFGLGNIAPDLLTISLLLAAREVGMGTAAGIGFAFGLLLDAFSLLAFGANSVAMTLIGAAGARTRDLFVGDSFFFVVSYLFLGKWVKDLLYWALVGEGIREPFVQAILVGSSVNALYAAAVGVLVVTVTGAWWESLR